MELQYMTCSVLLSLAWKLHCVIVILRGGYQIFLVEYDRSIVNYVVINSSDKLTHDMIWKLTVSKIREWRKSIKIKANAVIVLHALN